MCACARSGRATQKFSTGHRSLPGVCCRTRLRRTHLGAEHRRENIDAKRDQDSSVRCDAGASLVWRLCEDRIHEDTELAHGTEPS